MKLVLDTNRYSDLGRGEPEVVALLVAAEAIAVPVIVLGELRTGFRQGNREAQNEAALQKFLAQKDVRVLSVDSATSFIYAALEAELRTRGTPIPTNDVWIAALTLQHGLSLYTRDPHFNYLPQVPQV